MTLKELIEARNKEFDGAFDWKDCGKFVPTDGVVRDCYKCGYQIEFCANCSHDHHTENRDRAIKHFQEQSIREGYALAFEEVREAILKQQDDFTGTERSVGVRRAAYRQALKDILSRLQALSNEINK